MYVRWATCDSFYINIQWCLVNYILIYIFGFQFFQVRAHMYQARSLIGSDASGLSDPFARVIIGEYCKTTQVNLRWELCILCWCKVRPLHFLPLKTHFSLLVTLQVIDETLSPTWDELLVFEEVLVYGRREDIKTNPPTVIIEIYDQDKVYTTTQHYLDLCLLTHFFNYE